MMKCWWVFWLLITATTNHAEEVISRFHSDVVIDLNGSITVTETIDVIAENININRGIYRDFPTQYFGNWMTQKRVGFKVLSVSRNGQIEPFHTEKMSNGIRIYIGSPNIYLPKGPHQYQIVYQTDKQLGYFEAYDEFYWNVTGTGWMFPILKASTHIQLPDNGHLEILDQSAWTGYQGQQEQAYKITNDATGLGFETTRRLLPYQGLTIGIQFPKGIVNPEPYDLLGFLADNILWLISALLLLFYLGFYLSAWYRFGRDPEQGVIVARFYPPKGLSPAATHYIDSEQTNNHTFTAAILSLATKGYLTITQLKKQYRLNLLPAQSIKPLSQGEKTLKRNLFPGKSQQLIISKTYNSTLHHAKHKLFSGLKNEYKTRCFVDNRAYMLWGWLISCVVLFVGTLLIYQQTLTTTELMITIISLFIGLSMVWAFLLVAPIIVGLLILIGLASSYLDIFHFLIEHQSWFYFVFFVLGVNLIFAYLLRAPTPFGRHIKDEIDGLKLYMKSAEENRLNILNPPEKTIAYYEQLLPYAIALGLENQWSEKFANVLNNQNIDSSTVASNYQPSWFQNQYNDQDFSDFSARSISRSISKTVAAASVIPSAPSSPSSGSYSSSSSSSSSSSYSSSSSSGSSGGGGGGGGGGGW